MGNKLILDRVTRDDFGVYQCMASNTVNDEDRTVVFEVTLVERGEFLHHYVYMPLFVVLLCVVLLFEIVHILLTLVIKLLLIF